MPLVMPLWSDDPTVIVLSIVAAWGFWAACKLRDRLVAGRVGAGAPGRVAVVPDPRRGSPLFDQDAD